MLLALALLTGLYVAAQSGAGERPAKSGTSTNVTRGKYIVEDVAMCGQCHTPRNDNGELDRSKWLEGASLWLQPSRPTTDWPLKAPRIGGNPSGTDADLIKLLTTGVWQDNKTLRPPMPPFRMTQEDAEAVVAYLRSLSPTPE
jgi:mono/diheme cytochrome c family protein